MEFPRLVYRSSSTHELAGDQEQYDALLADGWFDSVPDAIAGKRKAVDAPVVDEVAQPTRDELEVKAKELGIKFTKKMTDEELGQLIATALEA